jgi:predicted secreted Zn-dependent protease
MLAVAVAGLLLQATSVSPRVDETVEYYDVTGSSAPELRAVMDRLGPETDDGERFDALTIWHVRWRYRYESDGDACAISAFTTSVEIRMTLPRWSFRAAGSPLAERWDRYIDALVDHERRHADIGVRAAEAIQRQVSALEPASTCALLEETIQEHAERLLDQYRDEEIRYDERTRHGATQGAVFP